MCENCKEGHWPAVAMEFPDHYLVWKDHLPKGRCHANSDFCHIDHGDQIDHFIRCISYQKVKGTDKILEYGPWISASLKMIADYEQNQRTKINREGEPLGMGYWSCRLPFYNMDILSVPCKVFFNKPRFRPIVEPSAEYCHPFVNDFHSGIELKQAEELIKLVLEKGQKGNCQNCDSFKK